MILEKLSLWPYKLKDGLELARIFYEKYGMLLPKNISKIAFVGMGGSGIAGRILKTLLDKKAGITCLVIDSSEIPASLDQQTLAIVMSYSGNTWETISALNQLLDKAIPTLIMTHGGYALEIAQAKNIPVVLMPESEAPRSALGNFLGFLLSLFDFMGILEGKKLINGFCKHADEVMPIFTQESYFAEFVSKVKDREFFHIWGVSGDSAACAYRAQTQFNENSKIHAVYSVFPELCHNLIVGFTEAKNRPFVFFSHTSFVSAPLRIAIEATCEILKEKGVDLYKMPVLGDTFENQLFNMILWADFASCYVGRARSVEVAPVRLIDGLKEKHKQKGIKL